MNKRIHKKLQKRSAELYRQNPTANALLEHYKRFDEVLTPIPEDVQKAIDAANRIIGFLVENMLIVVKMIIEYFSHGESKSSEEPIGLIHQREDESE